MTSRLSSDIIQQLTPLLGSLARLVARGSRLSDAELYTLLVGSGLESEPAAVEELRRWGKLLVTLRQRPSEGLRNATVEALMLRGLPEAPVLLAVTTVAESTSAPIRPSDPTRPRQVTTNLASLDFGTLPSGQSASLELEVKGGPGQIVVDSDQVRVTPQRFGKKPTSIRVEVKPIAEGILWTSLKLVTASETVEVPMLAQWEKTIPTGGAAEAGTSGPAEEEPTRVHTTFSWPKFLGTLVLFTIIGGLFSGIGSYLVGQAALHGLNDELKAPLIGLGLLSALFVGLMMGNAFGGLNGFSRLGFLFGSGLSIPALGYLFLAMVAEFWSLRTVGGNPLAYMGVAAVGVFISVLLGSFRGLCKAQRTGLSLLIPLLLIMVPTWWVANDPRVWMETMTYRLSDWELTIPYIAVAEAAVPGLTPVVPVATPTPSSAHTLTATSTPTPRALPTRTPTRTPWPQQEGEHIRTGIKVRVINTGGKRLRIREKPGIDAILLLGVEEGTVLEVVGGPVVAENYTWWKVKWGSTVGWAAQDWLEPAK